MKIQGINSPVVLANQIPLLEYLDQVMSSFFPLPSHSVVAITSKVVSLCEGAVVPIDPDNPAQKDQLIQQECERFIPRELNPYHVCLTIKSKKLIATAGIDESNADGVFVLWPKDPQSTANKIRAHLREKASGPIGVILTDSATSLLQWGTRGISLAHSGFQEINSYIGNPDLFGRSMKITKSNVSAGLAAAAVVVMGEGTEQTPLALLTDLPFVQFTDRDPTEQELQSVQIKPEDDLYAQLLVNAPWQVGQSKTRL